MKAFDYLFFFAGFEAVTIHRLLDAKEDAGFEKNAENPLSVCGLVIFDFFFGATASKMVNFILRLILW